MTKKMTTSAQSIRDEPGSEVGAGTWSTPKKCVKVTIFKSKTAVCIYVTVCNEGKDLVAVESGSEGVGSVSPKETKPNCSTFRIEEAKEVSIHQTGGERPAEGTYSIKECPPKPKEKR